MRLLARAEFQRLAEHEWRKLKNSKDAEALQGFCSLFAEAPQIKLAQTRILALVSHKKAIEASHRGGTWRGAVSALLNRHPNVTSLVWLSVGFSIAIGLLILFDDRKWSYVKLVSAPENTGINGFLLGLVVIFVSAFYCIRIRRPSLKFFEVVVYWFGCSVSLGYWAALLWGVSQGSGGIALAISASIVCLSGAATLVWWRAQALDAAVSVVVQKIEATKPTGTKPKEPKTLFKLWLDLAFGRKD